MYMYTCTTLYALTITVCTHCNTCMPVHVHAYMHTCTHGIMCVKSTLATRKRKETVKEKSIYREKGEKDSVRTCTYTLYMYNIQCTCNYMCTCACIMCTCACIMYTRTCTLCTCTCTSKWSCAMSAYDEFAFIFCLLLSLLSCNFPERGRAFPDHH